MKAWTSALLALSLIGISSCSSCPEPTERVVYQNKYIYVHPQAAEPMPVEKPDRGIKLWGEHKQYRIKCEAAIDSCNAKLKSLYESIKSDQSGEKE